MSKETSIFLKESNKISKKYLIKNITDQNINDDQVL